MAFPRIGKDTEQANETAQGSAAQQDAGPSLATAEDPEDQGFLGGTAVRLVENILEVGIDGKGPFDSAERVADRALADAPDREGAVDKVVREHIKLGAAGGFVTSVGGFFTLPVALPANVLGFYLLATRMTAGVARVRGYDIRQPQIRSAVLLTLVGADADDLLAKAGVVVPAGRLSSLAAERLPGPAVMVVNKAIGFRLLAGAGGKTFSRFGKAVPVVGGVLGASLDVYLLRRLADQSRHEFPPRQLGG